MKRQLDPQTIEKYTQVWIGRMMGLSYEEIARAVGYADKSGAKRAFDAAAERFPVETIEQQRFVQSERLDQLLKRAMKRVEDGDLSLIDTCLRIEKRRAELWGLDAPRKTEVTGKDGDPIEVDFVGDVLRMIESVESAHDSADDELR